QQAINQVLQPIFEPTFSDNSFGFRPKRSAHHVIIRAKSYYEQGYKYVVDLDMKSYFDTVIMTNSCTSWKNRYLISECFT
ncbi:hypothetical protein KM909_19850, partial [Virgibacillus pantothenticus]